MDGILNSELKPPNPVTVIFKEEMAFELRSEPLRSQNRFIHLIRLRPRPKTEEKNGFFSSLGIGRMFKTIEYTMKKSKFGFSFDPMAGRYVGGYSSEFEYQYPRDEIEPSEVAQGTSLFEGSGLPMRAIQASEPEFDFGIGIKTFRLDEDGNIVRNCSKSSKSTFLRLMMNRSSWRTEGLQSS